jgi:hypothetical protein
MRSPGSPTSRVIAVIGKHKTLPLMNADNTDRKNSCSILNIWQSRRFWRRDPSLCSGFRVQASAQRRVYTVVFESMDF